MLICLHIAWGCFHTVAAKLSSCNAGHMAHHAEMFISRPFPGKVSATLFGDIYKYKCTYLKYFLYRHLVEKIFKFMVEVASKWESKDRV